MGGGLLAARVEPCRAEGRRAGYSSPASGGEDAAPTDGRSQARAGHGRRNKSDEELAEEDGLASADLLAVYREDWPRLVVRLEALYRVGELHGLAAVKVWLTEHGISWRELTQAPRWPRQHRPAQPAPRVARLATMRR
jgi:hypothetical protein